MFRKGYKRKQLEHTMLQIFNGICTLSLNLPTNLACTEKN